ncbi:glutathione-dependent formaldehyde-activating protein GFA [Rhizodiscina lignyota]|uniref:Glutathione-dependent formaldehyde-activating protein GFA n=1 Tax=Rhizodiscina lignyota TaxID=1504668 RepID=A0A9P4M9W1_9PEZI|nr:glutathione-dependent formaldehyde-activating protein GFA [Rhizodiscina lignyota]
MAETTPSRSKYTGSCLCGTVRWTSTTEPNFSGYCCCNSCRKASGSGFVPFMGFPASSLTITNTSNLQQYTSLSDSGTPAVRNFCINCGSLIFGGEYAVDDEHTVYAGTLDDASLFKPKAAIFDSERPEWVELPEGIKRIPKM